MRSTTSARRYDGLAWTVAALLLLRPLAGAAACNPATCDAVFACGFKECVGVTCETSFEDAGTPCRAAAGDCDVAETCSGSSVSCPSDKKKSAATVCRASVDECDAAEHCTGASAACPADGDITPTIDTVTVLERRITSASGEDHVLSIALDGANLCTLAFDAPATLHLPHQIAYSTPNARISDDDRFVLNFDFPSDTYSFDVNRGAVVGTIAFTPGSPNQGPFIDAPLDGATVGAHPEAIFGTECTSCELLRVWVSAVNGVSDVEELEPIGGVGSFAPPITSTVDLAALAGTPVAGLAAGSYGFEAEVIDGVVAPDQTFEGDSSGATFTYISGTSHLFSVDFTVPEPAPVSSALATVAALAAFVQRRRR